MSNKIFFTPGPTQLHQSIPHFFKQAMNEDIGSISHRGTAFQEMFANTRQKLADLLELPSGYHIYFTSSANEIWERMVQNLVGRDCHFFVNGAFSRKFYDFALNYQKRATLNEATPGEPFTTLKVPGKPELIGITLNETSTGHAFDLTEIASIRQENPDALIAVDGVSALPSLPLDFSQVDSAYFSVQKCFGMPSGLGVWICNEKCLEKAEQLEKDGAITGSYHRLLSLHDFALKNQTPETPNTLFIYLLGKVVEDMLERGIKSLRNDTVYKSTILYQAIEEGKSLSPFIKEKKYRSKTVVVANCEGGNKEIRDYFAKRGWVLGSGYGEFKSGHIRIANFPMHSKEQVEQLCDHLVKF